MIKNIRKNKGITLIALVITIIVLLILAGVTINAIVGNESSMEKAKQAKTENEKGNELDLIKLAVTDAMVKSDDGQIKLNDLNESLNELITANATGNSPWTVTGNAGYKYRITQYGEVTLSSTVDIGDSVNYSTSLNGVTLDDWEVFYVDGDYTYLILSDYLPNSAVSDVIKTSYNLTNGNGAYSIKSTTNRKDLIDAMTEKSNWDSLLTGTLNGNPVNEIRTANVWAIGSPALDLYANSWNEKYPSDKIYIAQTKITMSDGYYGYYVGSSENQKTSYVIKSNSDSLYCPHTSMYESCGGYWLIAPWARSEDYVMFEYYDGHVGIVQCDDTSLAYRPVICLPSSILQ